MVGGVSRIETAGAAAEYLRRNGRGCDIGRVALAAPLAKYRSSRDHRAIGQPATPLKRAALSLKWRYKCSVFREISATNFNEIADFFNETPNFFAFGLVLWMVHKKRPLEISPAARSIIMEEYKRKVLSLCRNVIAYGHRFNH